MLSVDFKHYKTSWDLKNQLKLTNILTHLLKELVETKINNLAVKDSIEIGKNGNSFTNSN
jgi:hypothetical protein